MLCGKVVDPGGRLGEVAVAFSHGDGDWFGGEQGFDRLVGVAAAQSGVGGEGQAPGAGGGVLPTVPAVMTWATVCSRCWYRSRRSR